ncbi:MAG: hypothetical protein ACK5NK_12945 [Niabella sp.]
MDVLKREQIKDRMIRLAAVHWNIPENEIDTNFDPLLTLIFDAIAAELESVGYQIRDIQKTLLDELSTIMLPQALLRAKPASCILTAQPSEAISILKKENNFNTIPQIQKPGETVKETNLNFTPIGEVKLFKCQLGFLKIGNHTYKYLPDGKKILIHEDNTPQSLVNEIHFSISSNLQIESLEGLQLFFDLRSHSEANNFYFILQNSELKINDRPVTFTKGFYKNEQYQPNIKDAFNKDADYSRKLQKEIAAMYANQFITIAEAKIETAPTSHAIMENLPENNLQEITKPHSIFCTLHLSRPFEQSVLERMQLGINAFPAINRKLEKVNFKTEQWVNIIPLSIDGSYLDIQSIEGDTGTHYKIQLNQDDGELDIGEAVIRSARVGKKSSHDIRNTIKSLLEAIRDESAYFSQTSNNFISTRLTEISKILTRLEDKVELSKDEKPTFRYVLLRAKKPQENVLVTYWTTSPQEAAFVKSNASFKPVQHTLTEISTTFSLTAAIGGVENLSDYSQRQLLLRQLSSKGKIISLEDVKLLCYELYGAKLKKVQVEKKMTVMTGNNAGIARVISITIQIQKSDYTENELIYLEKQLRYQLTTNGSFMFPFEINILTL